MTSWVAEKEAHIETFEKKIKALGLSTHKKFRTTCGYTDPEVLKLWGFYEAGAMVENNDWQQGYNWELQVKTDVISIDVGFLLGYNKFFSQN